MNTPDDVESTGDEPVEVQDVLKVPEDDAQAPSKPSDQPPLPDFNS